MKELLVGPGNIIRKIIGLGCRSLLALGLALWLDNHVAGFAALQM